jgi:hypothetical protein
MAFECQSRFKLSHSPIPLRSQLLFVYFVSCRHRWLQNILEVMASKLAHEGSKQLPTGGSMVQLVVTEQIQGL